MELTTRCPHCAVEFVVNLQQLQLRKGYIRCVNCAHIFDGYEAVIPAGGAEPTLPPVAPAVPASSGGDPGATVPIRVREASEGIGRPPVFTVREPRHPSQPTPRHTIGDTLRETLGDDGRGPDTGLYAEPRHDRVGGSQFDPDETRSGIGFAGVFWSLLLLFGLAAALLQAAYIYRVQLASEFPALRPALERYCEALACTVEYPRRLAQIVIMDSSLQAVREAQDPGADDDASRLMLSLVLRNNFDRPQQWPSISVDLVDVAGVVAARRALAPADYLPELSLQRPFPAQSEVRVSVPVTVEGVRINGYQLNTFFP